MRYAAFLRAINVGTHNRIKMAELRDLCLGAGLLDVSTYVQTGNLVFEHPEPAGSVTATIEAMLLARGLRGASAVVRTLPELEELLADRSFEAFPEEQYIRYVTLFRSDLPAGLEAPKSAQFAVAAIRKREILAARPRNGEPGLDVNGFLSKQARLEGTTRYWHVVEAVTALLRGS
jgi:uncharacterized protein (DUF1697 family)